MLTKKHFEQAASIVRQMEQEVGSHAAMVLTRHLSDWFEAENERFDAGRFYTACSPDKLK